MSSLLGRFTAMGLVVVAALGLAIGFVLKHQIEERALAHAVQNARMIAEVGVGSQLGNGDLRYPVSLERLAEIDREIGARFFDDNGILTVKLFNRDGRLVYSDDRTIIGGHAFKGGNVYTALSGEVVRNLEHGTADDGAGERVLEVYVPIRLAPGGEPSGVLEVYMSYDAVAEEVREDVLLLALLLGGGLVILFARSLPDRRRRLAAPAPPGAARRADRPAQPRRCCTGAPSASCAATTPPRCC